MVNTQGVGRALMWTPTGQLASFFDGALTNGRPAEQYLYDAAGWRFAWMPMGYTSAVELTLRDPSGRALSTYEVRPGEAHPVLVNDHIYALGRQVVERWDRDECAVDSLREPDGRKWWGTEGDEMATCVLHAGSSCRHVWL